MKAKKTGLFQTIKMKGIKMKVPGLKVRIEQNKKKPLIDVIFRSNY